MVAVAPGAIAFPSRHKWHPTKCAWWKFPSNSRHPPTFSPSSKHTHSVKICLRSLFIVVYHSQSVDCLFKFMASSISSLVDRVRTYAGAVAWDPIIKSCRRSILSLLSEIKIGRLTVVESDGTETVCGQAGEHVEPLARLQVVRDAFWLRLALFADMVSLPPPLESQRVDLGSRVSPSHSCLVRLNAQTSPHFSR